MLWSPSDDKPYDDSRESEIARTRFAPAIAAVEKAVRSATGVGRRLRVLDFGCADGHTAEQILAPFAGNIDYFGCDIYPLAATLERMAGAGFATRVCGDGLAGIPDDWPEFDVVLALSCFQYIPEPDKVFTSLVSRLAVRGILIGYFYDASPLRQCTDEYFRRVSTVSADLPTEERIAMLAPLAALFEAVREATTGASVQVPLDVPELALEAGAIPLQRLLIDHVLFAWSPRDAPRRRIQWALAEMFLTGPQTYLSAEAVAELLSANSLAARQVVSGPSGHLVIAEREEGPPGVPASRSGPADPRAGTMFPWSRYGVSDPGAAKKGHCHAALSTRRCRALACLLRE